MHLATVLTVAGRNTLQNFMWKIFAILFSAIFMGIIDSDPSVTNP